MKRLLALTLLLAAGCERPEEVSPEVAERRFAATRTYCAAAELARKAEDDYRTLEQTFPAPRDPTGQMMRGAASAALQYSQAYLQHAQLRAAAAAQLDSAMNFSPADADSARHAAAASQFAVRVPEAGTVEANVYTAYQQDLAGIVTDPNHPCNWERVEE